MLYNARINEFNHDFNVEGIDILLILRQVINDNKKLLIRNKIFPKIAGEDAIIQTDKKWIYFVINQIVINAIKYTVATEKDKKTINFKIEEDTAKITVSIEDNGIGIPKEDLGRVFNAFFTGKMVEKPLSLQVWGCIYQNVFAMSLEMNYTLNQKKEKEQHFI